MPFYQTVEQIRTLSRHNPSNIIENVSNIISKLETLGKDLDAVTFTDQKFSISQANKIKNSNLNLPLYGVPMAHKELYCRYIDEFQSWPNEGGSKSFEGRKSTQTSTVISLLDNAGSVDCGRLVSVEYAFGVTGHNSYSGTPKNPWNQDYVCGGSSSGSGSIVAAGIVPAALGSDTGGSVRLPAAACGLVGVKPTQGLISRAGVFPLSSTLDSVGPLARSTIDATEILQVISGYDPKDKLSFRSPKYDYLSEIEKDISKIKLGLPKNYFLTGSDDDVSDKTVSCFSLAEKLGVKCIDVNVPDIENSNDLNLLMISSEAYQIHKEYLFEKHSLLNDQTLMRILAGVFTQKTDYEKLKEYRASFIVKILSEVFEKIDILITPVWPCLIPKIDESDIGANPEAAYLVKRIGHNTRPVNFMGLPAVCIPIGLDKNGLPMSIQLIGKPYSESVLLKLAHHLEREYDFWSQRPKT